MKTTPPPFYTNEITDTCRANRGDDGAIEAMLDDLRERAREVYATGAWPQGCGMTLVFGISQVRPPTPKEG